MGYGEYHGMVIECAMGVWVIQITTFMDLVGKLFDFHTAAQRYHTETLKYVNDQCFSNASLVKMHQTDNMNG